MTAPGLTRVVASARRGLGRLLRDRVAGEDAAQAAKQIWGKPGERWFAPDDPIWRVQSDASMFSGGIASLLLQSLHPLAMAGVAGHSGYRNDPWGRLQRTSHYLAWTTFGTIEDAEAAIEQVRVVHARVRGKDEKGRPYRADDPHLLEWVHVAEQYCFVNAHQLFGQQPLSTAEADLFVAQSALSARLLGAVDLPLTVEELNARLEAFRPELDVSAAAADAARFLLREPPLPLVARPGYATLVAGALVVLPPWARSMLSVSDRRELRPVLATLGSIGTRSVRWALAGID